MDTTAHTMPAKAGLSRLRFWMLAGAVIAAVLGLYLLGVARFAHQLQSDMQHSYEISPALGEPAKPAIDREPDRAPAIVAATQLPAP